MHVLLYIADVNNEKLDCTSKDSAVFMMYYMIGVIMWIMQPRTYKVMMIMLS